MLANNKNSDIKGGDKSKHVKPKTRKSESQKLSKFKKPSKSENLPKFNAKKNEPNFLTPSTRKTFNRLRLAFTKAPIFQHFDLEHHIWIKTNVSGYAICDVLCQLATGTRPDGVITKTNLS